MKIWALVFSFLVSATSFAGYSEAIYTHGYRKFAEESIEQTWKGIQSCGLHRTSAFDPRLPQPLIPATEAVVNSRGVVLAYSLDRTIGGWTPTYEFKNPNGGFNHWVSYDGFGVSFGTPYGGTVAKANTVTTVGGSYVQYFCRGGLVQPAQFNACVKQLWVDYIAAQLCRFPKN